ncbi:NADPH-dependent FMN reductase [Cryobacterium zongtaii]|uniref:NADPH-dependent FMN reductase n=1 Tax=Cryobacterium zongtaii TaxID=1259217 RepID=A0A2S3ZFM3_9MICO|nr:flavodoxin family protein [Cryobacterium zongtaii]POH65892.1 NADPH-dependent FMN reductase [Cryobacterium zongtaii]
MNDQPSIEVAVAYHSGYGHTERHAQAIVAGARQNPGSSASLFNVAELNDALWAGLSAADAIIFGAPTYMGSQSAVFQAFAEASASVWVVQGWKDKVAAGFTNSAGVNGDKLNTLTSLSLLAAQHGMHWVSLGLPPGWLYSSNGSIDDLNRLGGFLGAMAQSPSDASSAIAPPEADLRTAEYLGRRVAEVATRLRSLPAAGVRE